MMGCRHTDNMITLTALISTAVNGHDRCLEALIHAGAKVNVSDGQGMIPLVRSTYYGYNKCVDVLIQA